MNLKKAIFYKSKKRISILLAMLIFVMFAMYLSLSLSFSKYRIEDELKKRDLPHTLFMYFDYDWTTGEESNAYRIKEFAKSKGYEVTDTKVIDNGSIRLEAYNGENYQVVMGKKLEDLGLNEIAVSKEYAQTLGDNPIGTKLDFYYDNVVTVESIIAYPNYELAYQPLASLSNVDLFKEGMLGSAIASYETVETIYDTFLLDDYNYAPDYTPKMLKIKYDNFTFEKEKELVNYSSYKASHHFFIDDIIQIDSLEILTKSNPLIEMLKSSISKFVVSAIIISSTYAFYIHLKNELHSKRKTLATLNLTGVSFKMVLKTYYKFFFKLFIGSYLSTSLIAYILGLIKPNFRPNPKLLIYLFGLSLVFMIVITLIFTINLISNKKNGFEEIQSGGLSYLYLGKMTQAKLTKNLALKRFTKIIDLTLGFSLSLALSIAVVLVSLSALNSVSNVYQKNTLGLNFDYYLINPDVETFLELKNNDIDIAQVTKQQNIIFVDYSINNPVDNVTTGSVVTVYDDIEAFIDLDKGEIPPHSSTFMGEFAEDRLDRIELLASKRLMDKNDLYVQSDPNGPVDKHYLFMKYGLNYYETGLPIHGSFVSLMDRGFVSYFYRLLNIQEQEFGYVQPHPSIVKLDRKISPNEFEEKMNSRNIEFVRMEQILEEFSQSNEKINQDSFDILMIIILAMTVQTIFNLSGVLVQVKLNKEREDEFYQKIGLSNNLLKDVNKLEILMRFLTTALMLIILSLVLIPLLNRSIAYAFAIKQLPTSLLKEIILASTVTFILLALLVQIKSKYKGEKYVKN